MTMHEQIMSQLRSAYCDIPKGNTPEFEEMLEECKTARERILLRRLDEVREILERTQYEGFDRKEN